MHLRRLTFRAAIAVLAVSAIPSVPAHADVTITRGTRLTVDATTDGRLSFDLLGDLWIIPGAGGEARQLTQNTGTVQRPRWSPNATEIAYQATVDGVQGIWIYDLASETSRNLSSASALDLHPEWHPDGTRIVFSSGRSGQGFDLWEIDVPTGLQWRISDRRGDETEPAWSMDGRSLVYVSQHDKQWSLVLRRHGKREEVLLTSFDKLSAPGFRPDGSLITFYRSGSARPTLEMIILSTPRLIRKLAGNEDFALTPVSWLDRQQMVYAASDGLRRRTFGAWSSQRLPFRATVLPAPLVQDDRIREELSWLDEPPGELLIHASRLFDGIANDYRHNHDIAIRGGRIVAVAPHHEHSNAIVIDMGDLTVLPGFIDADARMPNGLAASHGPDLLSLGITTAVTAKARNDELNALWSSKSIPGPRLLSAARWPLAPLTRPELDVTAAVVGSRATGQTTGIALPSQLRILTLAGLTPAQSLRAIGVNAAAALRADPYLGRIATGASADLVFVSGDPLVEIDDALNVVAVIRNGRFYSVSGLLDRAKAAENVE